MGIITRFPYQAILILGLIIVFGHNILDSVESTKQGLFWDLAHNGNFTTHAIGSHKILIIYPFLPWLGLMMLGYCIGKIFTPAFDQQRRKKILLQLGLSSILFFIALRYINDYGNPFHWENQSTAVMTILSFMNVHKYPPSLLYLCITIGPALIFLSLFENSNTKLSRFISVYGQVPFFYYVLHFYLIHLTCMVLFLFRGHSFNEQTPDIFGIPFRFLIAGEGYSLKIVYLIWISIVLVLYPLCKWFSELKKRRKDWWMSYL